MNIVVIGKSGLKITEAMELHAVSSSTKLENVLPEDAVVEFAVKVDKGNHSVEASTKLAHQHVRVKIVTDDYYDSITKATSLIKAKIVKHKEKLKSVRTKQVNKSEITSKINDDEDVEVNLFAKVKDLSRCDLKPISEEEAVYQLEALNHDFYLFTREDYKICLVYRRNNGTYGLITT